MTDADEADRLARKGRLFMSGVADGYACYEVTDETADFGPIKMVKLRWIPGYYGYRDTTIDAQQGWAPYAHTKLCAENERKVRSMFDPPQGEA